MSHVQEYLGRLHFRSDHRVGPDRLLVAIACRIGDLEEAVDFLLDTAGEWCVLPPHLAEELGVVPEGLPCRLSTRLGTFFGTLERLPVHFLDEEENLLTITATWFVSADWPGPPVLGWKGCLERFRFGFDPAGEWFFFGRINEPE